jgi:membrane-bound lytic murein transglycosylase A
VAPSTTAPGTSAPTAAAPADVLVMRERALARDPSYVFFRAVQDVPPADGPPGALGVALTPGRSIAIDPRAAPLGYPMFLAAQAQPDGAPLQRMVMAQDTGGAIRGAVRADYFWGFGREAGRQAFGTNLRGALWLLVPREEVAQLASGSVRTRGAPAGAAFVDRECLLPGDPLCAGE